MRERRARLARAIILLVAVASPLAAQSAYPHVEDASAPLKGMFRFRAATLWTRYDARFATDGSHRLRRGMSRNSMRRALASDSKNVLESMTAKRTSMFACDRPFRSSIA